MEVRKAERRDLDAVERIYDRIHDLEEAGESAIGWLRGIYPTRKTAQAAVERGDLFVMEDAGEVVAAAVINRLQVPDYKYAKWEYEAGEDEVMVLHTLTVAPWAGRKGYGKAFVQFYEDYAAENGCPELRMDTNARNERARAMYARLGYTETDIVPCEFNGIPGVKLVCLEKRLSL